MCADAAHNRWTSRRRLLTALSCGIPDRVPINTYELAGRNRRDWCNQQPSYRGLMDYIRAHTDCITNWNPRPATDRYTCEERFLCSDYPVEIEARTEAIGQFERTTNVCHTPKGDLRQVTQKTADVHTTWQVEHWCKSIADVDKALSVPYEPARYDSSDLARVLSELGEHGLIMASVGDPAYLAADLMSFQDYMMWAFEETDHFARTVEIVAERVMENLQRQLDCCVLDVYRIVGPEYFTPPYLPPAMFKRFVMPHVTEMTRLIHERGAKVRLHCHGKVGRVLDLILETGCDGIDPCEPPPDGDIRLDELKRRCQARGVSVWGNIELKLLEEGTPEQVRAEVRKVMGQAKEGGGFVLLPTAGPINVPLSFRTEANYKAFIDAGLELGRY
ncbi:MAG TPA: uroporphyrinogen decarboxylase family protein [Candidatus Paceibacterota bacterium]|nr:uroporphyrinogen decarboxylase family protein [Verrucomicrobiota bacterium]HSA08738.1 uroporphyrinogen decarboxylase family protein [Candidatus Paceibacterota bacterium]